MTIRDQLVLCLRTGLVQQELQQQVCRKLTMSFGKVSNEARALEAELKTELASASYVSVPQPRQTPATPGLEEWRETVGAELYFN